MKKLISATLLLVLLLAFSAPALATQYAYVKTPTKDGTVYVRSQAGAGKPIAGVANNGDTLIVLKKGNTWHRVRVVRTGVEGWMYGVYIQFIKDSSSEESTDAAVSSTYTADASRRDTDTVINRYGEISSSTGYANLRWGPGTDYSVIKKVYAGTELWVLEKNGSWYRCAVGSSVIGYVNANLVTLGDTVSNPKGKRGTVRSSDGYACVRDSASKYGTLLYTLDAGDSATVYESEGAWLRLTKSGSWNDAYIYRELVRFYFTATATGNVNIRKGPSTSYGKNGVLKNGSEVTLLATDGSFCRVDTGSQIGYVSASYLSF